ncbi:lysylphosphatidylglycerol synthase domain-containing protein [uncultured Schumannella sp.]|uniref:lysylphosphatidylglycerol synthase domain-containing protein n=1 Tax=uncultured Schumannella sp. TaxID=1195956 RepID=UPI0025FD91E8|nr:lysylphosphatidylglycerol synthase domain-containing protein [uncultured Schumannella sp.]
MRKNWRSISQIVFGALALAFLVWAITSRWDQVLTALQDLAPLGVLAAAVLIFAGLYVNMLSWRAVAAALGTPLTRSEAATVFFTAQLGKYLPGGVWPIVASARLGRAFGLSGTQSVGSMTIALLLSVTVASVIAVGAVFAVPDLDGATALVPVVLIAIGLVVLWPPILNRLLSKALRVLRRSEGLPPLSHRHMAAAGAWSLLSWALLGGALSALVGATSAPSWSDGAISVSAYALSWVAGFAALIVPAGVGVREGVLVLVLSGSLGVPTVLGIAVVHRVMMTLGDVAMLLFTARRRNKVLTPTENESPK